MMMKAYLVRQSCWLTHDPERKRLFITESFQMTADARALDLPLPQVIRKPEDTHTSDLSRLRLTECVYTHVNALTVFFYRVKVIEVTGILSAYSMSVQILISEKCEMPMISHVKMVVWQWQ